MGWTSGATEAGSSGSGLFTQNPAASVFRAARHALRRRLVVHESSRAPTTTRGSTSRTRWWSNTSRRGRSTRPGPCRWSSSTTRRRTTISSPSTARDRRPRQRLPPGWVRTGYRFLVYSDPAAAPAGAQPVCRLHAPAPYGDTRFYSASPQECASMLARACGALRCRKRGRVLHPGSRRDGRVSGQHAGRLSLSGQQGRAAPALHRRSRSARFDPRRRRLDRRRAPAAAGIAW